MGGDGWWRSRWAGEVTDGDKCLIKKGIHTWVVATGSGDPLDKLPVRCAPPVLIGGSDSSTNRVRSRTCHSLVAHAATFKIYQLARGLTRRRNCTSFISESGLTKTFSCDLHRSEILNQGTGIYKENYVQDAKTHVLCYSRVLPYCAWGIYVLSITSYITLLNIT